MKSLLASLCLLTASLVAGSASAATYFIHGASCAPTPGSQVMVGQYGVNAATSAPATVVCPLTLASWNSDVPFTLMIRAYDRSTTSDIVCTLNDMTYDGAFFRTATVKSSGADSSSGGYSTTGTASGYPYLTCTIPGLTSMGFSHLTSLLLTY